MSPALVPGAKRKGFSLKTSATFSGFPSGFHLFSVEKKKRFSTDPLDLPAGRTEASSARARLAEKKRQRDTKKGLARKRLLGLGRVFLSRDFRYRAIAAPVTTSSEPPVPSASSSTCLNMPAAVSLVTPRAW